MVAKNDTVTAEVAQLVLTLKRELKARGFTYRDLARSLRMSEASVKRVFANRRFTLVRLGEICRFLGLTMAELLELASTSVPALDTLTEEQEAELIADDKLVLVAVCALNHWALSDILDFYDLTRLETVRRLRILDRMGLIELLPGDRIRRRVKRDFAWIKDGPIHRFFVRQGLGDFLSGAFDADHESLEFANGMVTVAAQAELKLELRRLRAKLASLHDRSIAAPLADKSGVGVLLALRRWEPVAFARLRRAASARRA